MSQVSAGTVESREANALFRIPLGLATRIHLVGAAGADRADASAG